MQLGFLPQSDNDFLKARYAETLFCTWAHKKIPLSKKMTSMTVSFTMLMVKQFALCKLQCPEFVHFLKGPISKNRGHQLFS